VLAYVHAAISRNDGCEITEGGQVVTGGSFLFFP